MCQTLKIRNLSKTYPNGTKALQNINISLPYGMYGLLGPNGAGKSTLMRTIATLQNPDQGEIFFKDIDILNDKMSLRKVLGYLPQNFGLYPDFTAFQMLNKLAIFKGVLDKKTRYNLVNHLLELTNLYSHAHKKLGGFSGGMKQRIGIAQTLIGNPQLIIVDEPTAGLDPEERNRFYNILSEVSLNKVVILSTHIVDDITTLCSNLAIIKEGQVIKTGNVPQIIGDLDGKVWRKTIRKSELDEHRNRYKVVQVKMIAGRPVIHIYSEDNPANNFHIQSPSLEDVYFHLVNGSLQSEEA